MDKVAELDLKIYAYGRISNSVIHSFWNAEYLLSVLENTKESYQVGNENLT